MTKISGSTKPILGIVVPCYNEEAVLPETTRRLIKIVANMRKQGIVSDQSAIFYVDDGSEDNTWLVLNALATKHKEVCGIRLTNNRGQQNALLCGLMTVPGDILISVDADLQDDLEIIPQMVQHYLNGCEIVYGVRKDRKTDSLFKRMSSVTYYKLMKTLKVDIIFNHADFRLLSRRAIVALSEYNEVNLFLRGIVRLLGYKNVIVEYDRSERFAGDSKYPLRKMLSFAWQGITSFSTAPLRIITTLGIVVSLGSLALAIWGLFISLFTNSALPGWASTVVPIYFIGGIQLLSLGIIGEYIAKIYLEIKGRPKFHIDQITGSILMNLKTNQSKFGRNSE
jgi:polyisoprenyl-phosphate glycosyltransferase